MDEVWLRRAVDQFASVLIGAVQGRFDAMLASRRPRAAERKLSSDSELHYWTPSGIGLGSGSRVDRMRRFLGLSRELWIEIFGIL